MKRSLPDLTSDLRVLEETMVGSMDGRKLLRILQQAFAEIDLRLSELENQRSTAWPPASEDPTD